MNNFRKVTCIKEAMTFKVGDKGLTDWTGVLDPRMYVEVKHIDVSVYETFGSHHIQEYFNFDDCVDTGCECGSSKTFGKDCLPTFHSDYCPLYRGKK